MTGNLLDVWHPAAVTLLSGLASNPKRFGDNSPRRPAFTQAVHGASDLFVDVVDGGGEVSQLLNPLSRLGVVEAVASEGGLKGRHASRMLDTVLVCQGFLTSQNTTGLDGAA